MCLEATWHNKIDTASRGSLSKKSGLVILHCAGMSDGHKATALNAYSSLEDHLAKSGLIFFYNTYTVQGADMSDGHKATALNAYGSTSEMDMWHE